MHPYLFISLLNSGYISVDDQYLNEPKNVTVTVSEEVDLEQSSFYINEDLLDPEATQFEIFINQENESLFRYSLKNKKGEVLEESSTVITLDTVAPLIEIDCEGFFEDVIYFKEKDSLSIHIKDEHIKSSEIYIDDVMVSNQLESTIDIHTGNHSIRIIAIDSFENTTEKNITLHEIKDFVGNINVGYDAYILDPYVKLEFEERIDEFLDLVVLLDGKELFKKPCKDVDLIDFKLEQSGDISLKLVHQFVPISIPLFGYDQYNFHFSQEEPFLNIRCDSYYANENVFVYIDYDPRYIKTTNLEIWNGEVWIQRDIIDEIVFTAIPGKSIDYYARAVIEDKFGRVIEKEVFVTVDKKAPEINLFKGTVQLNSEQPNALNKSDILSFQVDEEADVEVKVFKNNLLLVNNTLNQALQGLDENDFLEVQLIATDQLKNQSIKTYYLMLEQKETLLPEDSFILSSSWQLIPIKNLVEEKETIEHIWKYENGIIVHEKKNEHTENMLKPTIRAIQKDNKIRLILIAPEDSNSYFEKIAINGERVHLSNLKHDKLGQLFYEFETQKGEYHVEIIAKNNKGAVTEYDETFVISRKNWIYVVSVLLASIVLLVIKYILKFIKHD